MKQAPPKWIEGAVSLLIPPACREHVLGDLHERYTGLRQYLADAARVTPMVLASQVRRTTDPQVFLVEALALYLSFLAAAWRLDGLPFLYDQSGFLRLAIPAALALIALTCANAYSNPAKRSPQAPILEAVLATVFPLLSQAILSVLNREWLVPRRTLLLGSGLSLLLITAIRWLFPHGGRQFLTAIPNVPIRQRAEEFQKRIRRRNYREYSAGTVVVAAFTFYVWKLHPLLMRVGSGLEVAGAVYLMYQIHKRGSAKALPTTMAPADCADFHRKELARQRDLCRSIWRWYLGPMIPGLIVFTLGVAPAQPVHFPDHGAGWMLYIAVAVLVFYGAAYLNRRAAAKLQQQIEDLDGMEDPR
jgi:hypothetical protein